MRGLSAFLSVATCPIPSAASTGRKKRPARKLTLWLTVLLSAVACSLPTAIAQGAPVNGTLPRPLAARARSQHRNRISSAPVTPGVPFIATPNVPASGMQSLASNQIIFSAWNAGNASTDDGDRVEQFGVSGASEISASTIDLGDGSQSSYSGLNYIISGIAVDAAKNEYFAVVDNLAPTYAITIQRGSLSGTGGVTTVFTIPFPDADDPNNADNTFVILGGLAIDPQTNTLYYAQAAENAATGDTVAQSTGIYQAAIQADGSISSPTLLTNVSAGLVNPDYVVLDPAADLAFFTDSIEAGGGFPATENLDEVNLITGHVAVLIENFFPTTDQNDLLQGLAINGNTLYLATVDYGDNTSTNNQILSIPLTISGSGSTATATAGTPTTLYSGTGADQPIDIVIDPAHSIFYTTGEQFVTTGEYYGAVYEGSLSGGTSLTQVLSMSTIVTNGDAAQDTDPSELVLLTQPVIAAGATANTITGAGAVTADSGVTVSDLDGQNLASAAISGALTGDTLSYNSGNPFTFTDGFTIAGSFSNGALTLSGNASPVDYQTALDSVTFSTTSTNTTARTLNWTVSDGVVSSAAATSTVDVSAYGASMKFAVSATSPVTAGASSSVMVTAQDAYGNTVLNDSDAVKITMTGSSTVLATMALSSGTATVNAKLTTVGMYTLTATDESNSSITGTSNLVTVNAITPTVTVTPGQSSVTTAHALSVMVSVGGGNGNPTPTGSVTLSSGSYTSSPTTLSSGSANINVPAGQLAVGTDTLNANYTPDSGSSSTYNTAAGSAPVTVVQAIGTCSTSNPNPNPNPESFAAVGDFNGDCRSDILWRNNTTQQVDIWLMNGTTFTSSGSPGAPTSDWVIQAAGDFNGDGKADILWRNSTTGQVFIWLMNGTTFTSSGSLGYVSSDWSVAGVGDFNGDGKADILWWNSTTGQVYLWLMNGTTMSGGGSVSYVSSGWNIAGIGDFNGDGKADILWRNSTTGQVYIWLMNGTTLTSSGSPGTPTSDWSIQGVGDFDGNGQSDILWRNSSTGQVYVWFMNGTTIATSGSLGYVSSAWVIQGVGDYDASGRAGILWRNSTTEQVYIWLMNGTTMTSTGSPGTPASAWQIAP
ncbi:MAG: VCBS repeat-containing protein [Acidobacteriaceae bacterium]